MPAIAGLPVPTPSTVAVHVRILPKAPLITRTSVPSGKVKKRYTATVNATGAKVTFTGKPTKAGKHKITLAGRDLHGRTARKSIVITIKRR
ncbi:hypothetical protein JK386_09485 [Nocardioides sp. zg-536]|uniref:Uncharacterized protein n=1 Tax=Nocardioides faecalis TaxID=2803858 RepID=A0A939BYN5_9ACTN|nr:hypothetical protein [Nocardioides faecalis]MBM9460135.1 hypothetical protein [Nocardioides faecalis]MBS4754233.1 hypothetical protein [Nocardioides faecalis]QVI60070.1 hypothetical protein KG111_07120 [Nocardioides faecalis]